MTPAQLAEDIHEQIRATRDTIDRGWALLAQVHARLDRSRIVRSAWSSPQNRYPPIPERPIRPDFNPALARRIEAAEEIAGSPKARAQPTVESPKPVPIESLTRRETEILSLLDARLSNEEIAAVLHLSSGTVKRHTSRIDRKLVLSTRRSAVARAHGLRLLPSRAPEGESPA